MLKDFFDTLAIHVGKSAFVVLIEFCLPNVDVLAEENYLLHFVHLEDTFQNFESPNAINVAQLADYFSIDLATM